MKKILIVGGKNTYRSIIAAEYLKKTLNEKGEKDSAAVNQGGIMAFPDIPAEPEAVAQLKNLNIEGDFKSSALSKQVVSEADTILTMSGKIKDAILAKFPEKKEVVFTLKEFAGDAEPDLQASDGVGVEIKSAVDKSIDKLV